MAMPVDRLLWFWPRRAPPRPTPVVPPRRIWLGDSAANRVLMAIGPQQVSSIAGLKTLSCHARFIDPTPPPDHSERQRTVYSMPIRFAISFDRPPRLTCFFTSSLPANIAPGAILIDAVAVNRGGFVLMIDSPIALTEEPLPFTWSASESLTATPVLPVPARSMTQRPMPPH